MNPSGNTPDPGHPWKIDDSVETYNLDAWGNGYFGINAEGHVVVRPDRTTEHEIDLLEVIRGLEARDLNTPIVLRFSDILQDRLRRLRDAFGTAIAENDYRGGYTSVFPVKVNQQRLVVEEIYAYGEEFGFGLEVGSKPELLAVMAMTEGESRRMIICNGFKDDSYIEAVILATKLGRAIIPVVENFSELQLILKHASTYDVRPRIGVRVKLASEGAGRWRDSSGEKSKFGLFISEILELFDVLRENGMEDCLELVHCHPGSQLQDIRRVKDAVNELAHVYAELKLMGAGLRYLDIGGGLGVDYDGSRTNYTSSMNYTLDEYASNVVYRVASVCDSRGISHPTIISESGRAVAAHHSLLVFNTLGSIRLDQFRIGQGEEQQIESDEQTAQPVRDLLEAYRAVSERQLVECYHNASQAREQALQMFNVGYLGLRARGLVERLYWATCAKIKDHCIRLGSFPQELRQLEAVLSDIYFCNVSIFQSLPDSWAIGQLFPIMPIHRLAEKPSRSGVLADITCDSDGKIDRFVSLRDSKRTLELHELRQGEPYYLAAFLVGAYQETLGDLHNLFGDTHVVHIKRHEEGGWWIEDTVKGETAAEVLHYMRYDVDKLFPRLARDCEQAVREKRLSLSESRALRRFYESELNGYTYLAPA